MKTFKENIAGAQQSAIIVRELNAFIRSEIKRIETSKGANHDSK
jgi:hypothetical protein